MSKAPQPLPPKPHSTVVSPPPPPRKPVYEGRQAEEMADVEGNTYIWHPVRGWILVSRKRG